MRKSTLVVLFVGLPLLAGLATWILSGALEDGGGARLAEAVRPDARPPNGFAAGADDPAAPQPVGLDAPSEPAASAEPETAEAPGDAEAAFPFRGHVVDHVGAPVAGATVIYWPSEATMPLYGMERTFVSDRSALDALPRAVTGRDGRFAIEGRHRPGSGVTGMFEDPMLVVVAGDFAIRSHDCHAYAGGAYDAGDIALEPGGWLTGRVVDPAGRPIAGVTIRPWNAEGRSLHGVARREEGFTRLSDVFAATRSGDDGRFRTGALWDGRAQVGIEAEGFLSHWIDEKVTITAGREHDLGELVLDPGASISGWVGDSAGSPVVGARILALPSSRYTSPSFLKDADGIVALLENMRDEQGVRTDVDGRFLAPNLAALNHRLFVDAAGFEPAFVEDVLPGRGEVDVALVRAATLRLLVTSRATGQPLPGAQARARRVSSDAAHARRTNLPVADTGEPGTLLIERLGTLRTEVSASAPGHAPQALVIEGVVPPARIERSIALVPESVLAGLVLGEDGAVLADAEVDLQPAERGADEVVTARPDGSGRYELRGLAAGEWELTADAPGRSPVRRRESLAEGVTRADVDFALPLSATVFGTCYADDGNLETGVSKTFDRLEGDDHGRVRLETRSDASGRYELQDVPVGRWRVNGNPTVEFELAPGERRQLDLREDPETAVEGRVLQADGTPVPGAWVFLTRSGPKGSRFPRMLRTDERGHWSWKPAQPGRAEVVASVPGGGGTSAMVVVVVLAGQPNVVDLHLGQGRVTGRVVEAGDAPRAGAIVRLLSLLDDGDPASWGNVSVNNEPFEFGVPTDADGRFELGHLAPGLYVADVHASGARAPEQAPFVLAPGETRDLLITVERTGRISGRVTLASGVPVPEDTYLHAEGPGDDSSAAVSAGRYELTGLLPGTWRLTISEVGTLLAERTVVLAQGENLEVDLILAD